MQAQRPLPPQSAGRLVPHWDIRIHRVARGPRCIPHRIQHAGAILSLRKMLGEREYFIVDDGDVETAELGCPHCREDVAVPEEDD